MLQFICRKGNAKKSKNKMLLTPISSCECGGHISRGGAIRKVRVGDRFELSWI